MRKNRNWSKVDDKEISRRWNDVENYETQASIYSNFPDRTEIAVQARIGVLKRRGFLPADRPVVNLVDAFPERARRTVLMRNGIALPYVSSLDDGFKYTKDKI